jgi:hypothetical protein
MVRFCDTLILKTGYLACHLLSPLRRCHELRSAARIGGSLGDRNIYPVIGVLQT